MAINYVVTKKVDTTKGETNVRYYATTRALQKKPVDSAEIARQLAEKSSLQDGDVSYQVLSPNICTKDAPLASTGWAISFPQSRVKEWKNRKSVLPTRYG
jgi:hypothetical protein